MDGIAVGRTEGSGEGYPLTYVGERVGRIVGENDGAMEGLGVGAPKGKCIGKQDGEMEGNEVLSPTAMRRA